MVQPRVAHAEHRVVEPDPVEVDVPRVDQDAVLDIMRVLQDRNLELSATNGRGVDDLLRHAGMGYGLIVAGTNATKPEGLSAEEMLTAMGINGYADFEHGEDVAKDLIDEYAEWKVEQPEEPDTEAEAA